jgi:predicted transposase/invertase (TIGR01784 family)
MLFADKDPYHLSFRLRCDQLELVFCNDLEFHTLELPKFTCSSDNIRNGSALEKWLYFLQHAEHHEADDLAELLGEPVFHEAVGVLEMISRSPADRQFYDARQKFIHDEEARLIAARQEGREIGEELGVLAGKIQVLQQLLGEPETAQRALLGRSIADLASQLVDLQARLRKRSD